MIEKSFFFIKNKVVWSQANLSFRFQYSVNTDISLPSPLISRRFNHMDYVGEAGVEGGAEARRIWLPLYWLCLRSSHTTRTSNNKLCSWFQAAPNLCATRCILAFWACAIQETLT